MTIKLIHLSDIHFRMNWAEDQGVVISNVIDDIECQIAEFDINNTYIVISGDIVLVGGNDELYSAFVEEIGSRLDSLGITKERRICVPGNHDISRNWIKNNKLNHESVLLQQLTEKEFNDYAQQPSSLLASKFDNYKKFEQEFAAYGIANEFMTGRGWTIGEEVGIYCLNSAIFSSGDSSSDRSNLAIDTRRLQEWNSSCRAKYKILVMHHPISWLNEWGRKEIELILEADFSLLLTGHEHEQSAVHYIKGSSRLVKCSAPALFTHKKDELGYGIVSMDAKEGVMDISYRQWTKYRSFVSGVNFSNTDNGLVEFSKNDKTKSTQRSSKSDAIERMLKSNLEATLKSFIEQPSIWINPELYEICENDKNSENLENKRVNLIELINRPKSAVITAPAQFGLSSLSHYLCLEAWKKNANTAWVRLDADLVRAFEFQEEIERQLVLFDLDGSCIECIVIDSWDNSNKEKVKLLKKISEYYGDIPILIMQTKNEHFFSSANSPAQVCGRKLAVLHLNSLSRMQIREIIVQYNALKHIHNDDEVLLNNIISDLKDLNLHRTPLNCLTLLKVSEVNFDDGPVNRTEVIKRILFLLFNVDKIATYKRRPDLKDCEHVLGWYCENILRENKLLFTRDKFLHSTREFCKKNMIDIEVHVLFDTLADNNIIVRKGTTFCFKFTYWVMYFAAQRMHQSNAFKKFIFEGKRYAAYPELIEFYTGIDRNRDDALDVLINDLREVQELVLGKVGFADEMNIYKYAQWSPTNQSIEKLQNEFENEVQQSNLPESIKDQYADRSYDPKKPYNQDINNIVQDYLLDLLAQLMSSSSRALRNSDYASPVIRMSLLTLIISCWELITKILLVLTPVLCEKGVGEFEGTKFILVGNAVNLTPKEKFICVLNNIPANVVDWFLNDLYSPKMGPLMFNYLHAEKNEIRNHYIAMMLIEKRPHNWRRELERYIGNAHKNSFYLYSVANTLEKEQKLGFTSLSNMTDIIYLRKMVLAKHKTGVKKPGKKLIDKCELIEKE